MKITSNSIILVLATLALAGGAYWYFSSQTGNQAPLTATGGNEAQTQFQALNSTLQISFDTKILSDPRFAALVNLATPITSESSGRIDPFATIPGVVGK